MNHNFSIESFVPDSMLDSALAAAFAEDLGGYGDITTLSTIDPEQQSTAHIVARVDGVLAGLTLAKKAFLHLDSKNQFRSHAHDGQAFEKNQKIATISGNTASILSAERVALNFLCHLSGIASLTRQYTDAVSGTKARITCTRKTRPLLRAFEKYAVRVGGGHNHRFNLSDAVLIKDNHIAACGDIKNAVFKAKSKLGHMVKISVEVDRIDQIPAALEGGADVILLDNMSANELKKCVDLINGRAVTEASGGIDLMKVRKVAESGVDYISVGKITHSSPWIDFGLDFDS